MNRPQAIRLAALARSVEASTYAGDLPPSSRVTGVRCSAAARSTTLAAASPPVKKMWSKRSASSAVVSGMPPSTTSAAPARYSGIHRARAAEVAGACSLGLSTTVLPAARAPASGASSSCSG